MNGQLTDLAKLLGDRFGTSERCLVDALFAIRAHYNLAAIILCCRHLVELLDRFPEFERGPAFDDQPKRVDVLRQVAQLEVDDDSHFLHGFVRHNKLNETPLRPFTGESGLCELLLIEPPAGISDQQQRDYDWLRTWFAWQTFYHQARRYKQERYERYLRGDGTPRLNQARGTRIYGASRAVRALAVPDAAAMMHQLVRLLREGMPDASLWLARMFRVALATKPSHLARNFLMREKGWTQAELKGWVERVQSISALHSGDEAGGAHSGLIEIGRFLGWVWLPTRAREAGLRAVEARIRRSATRLGVRRYGDTLSVSHAVDGDGVQDGFAVDVYAQPIKKRPRKKPAAAGRDEGVDDDPDDETPVEPEFTLFLASGDPVAGWYAAKSAAHHIERANALLPWPKWRLSRTAIAAVLDCVALRGEEPAATRWARLAIGLSLLSGRPLDDVAVPLLTAEGSLPTRIRIDPGYILVVPAGHPDLAVTPSASVLREYCAPWVETLRLPLPRAWWPLIDALVDKPKPRDTSVAEMAKQLLADLPTELAITPTGVAGALKLAVLEEGHDDLALVKALTDATDANLANLIHYASYERAAVEQLWRGIVSVWVGPLSPPLPVVQLGERVGAPFGIEIIKVADRILQLKTRFHASVRERRWDAVYNQLALYLSIWLGLATAGRRTQQPVPGIVTADGWALIRDKSRPDESTDRYVPLRETVREQIAVVRAFTQALSLVNPDFAVPPPGSEHMLDLNIFLANGSVRPFQPKYMDRTLVLRRLPGNWGRKLVRSSAKELPGRYKDAGLGHWVRGRHPWTHTSTFPSQVFRAGWLAVQERLERELGFEVLKVDGLEVEQGSPVSLLPDRPTINKVEGTRPEYKGDEIDSLLSRNRDLYAATFESDPPLPEAALGLAQWAVGRAKKGEEACTPAYAEAVCTYIRTRTKVPLFATRPRTRFQRNWLVSRYEFGCFAYFERELLPAIECDLAHLPERSDSRLDESLREQTQTCKQNVGRLIVALALRGGLACVSHLDTFLQYMASGLPVQAVGDARLVELQVSSKRSRELMRRTVLLEPYLAALVTEERDAIRPWLEQAFAVGPDKRRNRWNGALHAYLRFLDVPAKISVSALLDAVRQRIQLGASPVMAAYASGELLAHDLPVDEFCRLAGFERMQIKAQDPGLEARGMSDGEFERDEGPASDDQREQVELPADLCRSQSNFALRLCGFRSSYPSEWLRKIRGVREKAHTQHEWLLCDFAAYLVRDYAGRGGHRDRRNQEFDARLPRDSKQERYYVSNRFRSWIKAHLTVVWVGLIGFGRAGTDWTRIDESTVESLAYLTEGYFPARKHRGAWSRFRAFLLDPVADHAGLAIGELSGARVRSVSAKVLSGLELDRAQVLLASVRSGIGTAIHRQVACRHYALTRATGARRAETERLRWVDVDDGMLRIRPHAGHTLKTPASERVVPLRLVESTVWDELEALHDRGTSQVIDAVPGPPASGDNFFDASSKALKTVTGDPDFGPHHLRHTKASTLTLKMLSSAVNVELVDQDLPWVAGSLPSSDEVEVLLGSAGQCGQGLKAIAALLGHMHETTTLKHYVHTLGIALYAYQLGLPEIPLQTAFANRVGSRASLYRRAKQQQPSAQLARDLRDYIESLAQQRRVQRGLKERLVRSARKAAPQAAPSGGEHTAASTGNGRQIGDSRVDAFEALHRYFSTEDGRKPDAADNIRESLQAIAQIPSGKRGRSKPRHPMPCETRGGLRLPAMVNPGVAVAHAEQLLIWMGRLKVEQPQDYMWILNKWLYASDVLEGSMRIDGPREVARVRKISVDPGMELEIRETAIASSRRKAGAQPGYRLRIRFLMVSGGGAASPGYAGRASGAIRWALTWLVACEGVSKTQS